MFNLSLRGASLPLLFVGAGLGFVITGCGGGGTNLPRPGSSAGDLGTSGATTTGNTTAGATTGNTTAGATTGNTTAGATTGNTTAGTTAGNTTAGNTTAGGNNGAVLGVNALVFTSTRDGNPEIYSINADGTNPRRLTSNGAVDEQPSRSADGRFIAFSSQRDGNSEIYIMNADGSGVRQLTNDSAQPIDAPDDTNPVISPDGTKIVWQSDRNNVRRLYTMDITGANQQPVLFNDEAQPSFNGSWNPDSRRLLGYLVNPNDNSTNDLALISPATSATTRATSTILRAGTFAADARYSPNGQRIVQFNAENIGQARLQVLDANGNVIGDGPTGGSNQIGPTFSPGGNRLAWTADPTPGAGRQIYVANFSTTNTQGAGTPITSQGENYDASWTQ